MKKTIAPLLPPITLHRPSLIQLLSEAIGDISASISERTSSHKLVLLCAPAGYGKTTLLADFIQRKSISTCWYFLERADTDAIQFLETLLESIRQRFPHFGAMLNLAVSNLAIEDDNEPLVNQRLDAFVDALVTTISTEIPERFILALCDYHNVNPSQHINKLVNRFIRQLPPQCMLVLESRAVPSLEFAPLLARREMFGIGSDELQFTAQEIHKLAHLQGVPALTDDEATHLMRTFNGWITGILLGTRIGDLRSTRSDVDLNATWTTPAIRMDRHYLFAYLVDEIFSCVPELHAFLKNAVVLPQMTPSLCNALLEISDAATLLDSLEQQGLFVTCYNQGSQKYYTCHPILRALLYDDLRLHRFTHCRKLHLRAMELLQGAQDFAEAIHHALAAQAYDNAVSLIEMVCESTFAQGHTVTLIDWIDALPSEIMMHHKLLMLMRARLFLTTGELSQVSPLLDAATTLVTSERNTQEAATFLAKILILRSEVLFRQGHYIEAQELCQQAITQMPVGNLDDRAEAYLRLGTCACLLGNFAQGICELQQALQLCVYDTKTRLVARLHSGLATAYSMFGQDTLSEHHRRNAIQLWEALHDEWGKIDSLIGLAVMKYRQGALAEAERILTDTLAAASGSIRYLRGEAYILVSLGDIHQAQNCPVQALSAFEKGLTLANQIGDTYLINYTLCALSIAYLFMGDPHSALQLITQEKMVDQSYEFFLRELTLGTILLWQQRYSEASPHLAEAEAAFLRMKLTHEQLQAMLRLAACLLAQGQKITAIHRLEEAISLAQQSGYESLCLIEICRLPTLASHWEEPPDTIASLQALLHKWYEEANIVEVVQPSVESTAPTIVQPTLRIQALGEPLVLINEEPVTRWRVASAMELFFYLLHIDQSVHKERIISDLWSDADEQTDQKFRSSLHYLRRVLGASSIVSQNGIYTLNLASIYGGHICYDVATFQQHHANAQLALKTKDHEAAQSAFCAMIGIYRGGYVPSFYSDWSTACRDKLRLIYIDAHHQLALIAWRQEDFDECIQHWQYMLGIDSCSEEAHYGLMRCYLQQKKRSLALRQYQRCVVALRDELAVMPGSAIQHLYQRLTQP